MAFRKLMSRNGLWLSWGSFLWLYKRSAWRHCGASTVSILFHVEHFMACFHPIPAYRTRSGQVVLWKEPADSLFLRLPCGGCIGCRKAQARGWALRCYLELERHQRASFTTLTYDDAHLPVTLSKRHLQLFVKRARKALPAALRFFASGEYGEQNGRPHYHAILYGTEDAGLVHDAWKAGMTRTDRVTPERIAYCAGYTSKKYGDLVRAGEERIDYSTGEVYQWQPPFIQMSRRPGIGGEARRFAESWRSFAVFNGVRQPVPRFLHEAWKAQATPEEQEDLLYEKAALAARRDTSQERIEAAEQIAIAIQALTSERRRL